MEAFIFRAILVAIGVAIIAGSLGCFVIWKRLSYFSESISHSAFLGISLGILSGFGVQFGLVVVGGGFAVLIVVLQARKFLASDAILGIFSHVALSLGIVVLSKIGGVNTDYFGFLFGDILFITASDIGWVYGVLLIIVLWLAVFWQRLLLVSLNEELAKAEGVNYLFHQLVFMLMVALAVSVSVQIVGVLLITSLLIIPPAIASAFANSPAQMIGQSIGFSILSVLAGLGVSMQYDVATGPTIVIILGGLFVLSQLVSSK